MKNSIQQQAVRGVPFCSFYSTSFAFFLPDRKLTEAAAFPFSFLPPRELSRCLLVSTCGCPSLSPGCPSLITQPIIGSNGHDLLLVPLMKGLSCRNYLHASLRAQAPWPRAGGTPCPGTSQHPAGPSSQLRAAANYFPQDSNDPCSAVSVLKAFHPRIKMCGFLLPLRARSPRDLPRRRGMHRAALG